MDLDLEKLKAAALALIDGKAKIETGDIWGGDLADRIIKYREEATPEVISRLIAEIERLRSLNADYVCIIKQQPANNMIPDYLRNSSSGGERSPFPASWNVNSCGDRIKDAS